MTGRVAQLREAARRSPGLRKVLVIRVFAQLGDGMFQTALGGAILFSPERQTDPRSIAAGFAVLLLPYSLIGPFAGVLLDRWDRRSVLLWASVLRMLLILLIAAGLASRLMGSPTGGTILLLMALASIGVSRFVLAGLSAALPHVVHEKYLVTTNSAMTTIGSAFAAAGAGVAILITMIVGAGDLGSATAVAAASVGSVLGAVAASRLDRGSLGPDPLGPDLHAEPREAPGATVRSIAAGWSNGARAVWREPEVTAALIAIGAHRIVFGVNTLVMVLILRDSSQESRLPGGYPGFGVAVALATGGMLIAAVAAPILIPWLGRLRTIGCALLVAIVVQLGLVTPLEQDRLLLAAFLLGLAGQCIKLTGDAAMQIDIDDQHRGQVFALQDTVFNLAFVGAVALASLEVPADGRSLRVVLVAALVYGVSLVAVGCNSRRRPALAT